MTAGDWPSSTVFGRRALSTYAPCAGGCLVALTSRYAPATWRPAGTWTRYGSVPLCRRCAVELAGARLPLAPLTVELVGETVAA
jgi:hypothetical protein